MAGAEGGDGVEALVRRAERVAADPDSRWRPVAEEEARQILRYIPGLAAKRPDLVERCNVILASERATR